MITPVCTGGMYLVIKNLFSRTMIFMNHHHTYIYNKFIWMCDCKMLDLQNLHPLKFVHYTVWLVNLRGLNFCGFHGCLLSMKENMTSLHKV